MQIGGLNVGMVLSSRESQTDLKPWAVVTSASRARRIGTYFLFPSSCIVGPARGAKATVTEQFENSEGCTDRQLDRIGGLDNNCYSRVITVSPSTAIRRVPRMMKSPTGGFAGRPLWPDDARCDVSIEKNRDSTRCFRVSQRLDPYLPMMVTEAPAGQCCGTRKWRLGKAPIAALIAAVDLAGETPSLVSIADRRTRTANTNLGWLSRVGP